MTAWDRWYDDEGWTHDAHVMRFTPDRSIEDSLDYWRVSEASVTNP